MPALARIGLLESLATHGRYVKVWGDPRLRRSNGYVYLQAIE